VIAFGGCALGVVSLGGLAVALLAAFGGLAIAPVAIGGGALGYLAYGGGVLGVHPLGANASDEVARHFFGTWGSQASGHAGALFTVTMLVLTPLISLVVPLWLRRKMLADSANSSAQPFSGPVNRGEPALKAPGFAAMTFAGLAGVLGVVTICMFPNPPETLVWSILVSALLGIALGISSHKTRPGRWAITTGIINVAIWLLIAVVYVFRGNDAAFIKSDYVGQTWFPNGDSIEITSVERSNDRMTVKGHYNLVSSEKALLALYVTSSINSGMPQDSSQRTNISKGHGDFQLTHSHLVPGLPHVSMYAKGRDFAALYFGTQSEAFEASKASWITNTSPVLADTFSPVTEALVEPSSGQTGYDLDTGRTMELGGPGQPGADLVVKQTETGALSVSFVGTRAEHFPDGDVRWRVAARVIVTNLAIIPERADAFTNAYGLSWYAAQVPVNSASAPERYHPETYEFQTREGNMGVLQILGTNADPRGVKIRYKLVENTNAAPPAAVVVAPGNTATFRVAAIGTAPLSYQWYSTDTNDSAETWSPAIIAGEKPDFQKILNDAQDFMNHGQYEEALQRHIWYFNHSRLEPGQGAVRLSFALSSWTELGRRYPKARQALIEIRDHDTREITEGRGYSQLVQEVQAINRELQDDDATYALFKTIRAKDTQLAGQSYFYLEDLLVSKGEYQWCYDHMGEPQARFDQIHQNMEMQLDNEKRMADIQQKLAQQRADWNQRRGLTNTPSSAPPDNAATLKKFAVDGFVGKTRQLIEILVATGHMADAENIRDQAVKILDDPRLQSAIPDAQKAIQSKHAENTN
jgi:hypothetical protein